MARKERLALSENKTPSQISPGHEPVKFRDNYRYVLKRSQYYFEEVPRPRPPRHFPYQNWGKRWTRRDSNPHLGT